MVMRKFIILTVIALGLSGFALVRSNIKNSEESELEDQLGESETTASKKTYKESKEIRGDDEPEDKVYYEVIDDEYAKIKALDNDRPSTRMVENLGILDEDLYSRNAFLVDLDDNKVLYDLRGDEIEYPASLTKIMTTLIAIENCKNKDQSFSIDEETYNNFLWEDASMAGFLPYENVCFEDLVYGTMMPSGADASYGLAILSSGSEEDHVRAMNAKVKELGLKNTHFANVTGLHDENNYSSAKDLAKLMVYAMDNEDFKKVISKSYYTTHPTDYHHDGLDLHYSVSSYADDMGVHDYDIMGGKTGFTEEAGLCLASVAKINGKTYVLVTLRSPVADGHFEDAIYIYDKIYHYSEQAR